MAAIFGGTWLVGFLAVWTTGAPILAAIMCGIVLCIVVAVGGALWGMSNT